MCFFALLAAASDGFLGRWNLTVTAGSAQYPSWVEVTQADGKLTGRFVGRGGSVIPAEVEIAGDELRFSPGRPRSAKSQVSSQTYRARLVGGKLEGEGADNQGNPLRFTGVRSVRSPAPAREPRWGAPVTLFNGRDLTGWTFKNPRGSECWSVVDGTLVNKPPCSNIHSERTFRDFKLHVEFSLDASSNSGVYLRGRYEVQIADHAGREPDIHGAASIYSRITPAANAAGKPGEWQTFDITLIGYRVTVVYNGRTVIDNQELEGITGGAMDSDEAGPGPIMLQGDHGRVQFRKILITPGT